jgi:hypothetical protein
MKLHKYALLLAVLIAGCAAPPKQEQVRHLRKFPAGINVGQKPAIKEVQVSGVKKSK